MVPGSCPCLGPVGTFLHNLLGPIDPVPDPCPVPGPVPVQCEYTIILKYVPIQKDLCNCTFETWHTVAGIPVMY